jgi:hypothetical protein
MAYGIEFADYERMLDEQDGHCAICPSTEDLHVDHCHSTGVVRGLLCGPCNRGIGLLRDDTERLLAAARYLSR